MFTDLDQLPMSKGGLFIPSADASAFEIWLARTMNIIAEYNVQIDGWQHPGNIFDRFYFFDTLCQFPLPIFLG
jgi:hypothetical protein